MARTKKDFIALADTIKAHNEVTTRIFGRNAGRMTFSQEELDVLAAHFKQNYPAFKSNRWLDYIAGKCGKNGGAVKA